MSDQFWNQVKSKYRFEELIHGRVEHHAPFGIFIDIGDDKVRGIMQITDFVDSGDMTPEMYPDIGSPIGAVVVGYTEDERNQVWLSVKPSGLSRLK
jgi:ribosomal protein S1